MYFSFFFLRYPKLRSSHETQIAFDFRTKQKNALLLYTDDGAKNGNLYAVTICDGQIQFECRFGTFSCSIGISFFCLHLKQ